MQIERERERRYIRPEGTSLLECLASLPLPPPLQQAHPIAGAGGGQSRAGLAAASAPGAALLAL